MLKDITLGQFFPGDTIVHRLDARTKLILVIVYIAALFTAVDWFSYALMFAVTAACVALSKIKLGTILKGLKPLIFIIVLTGVLNLFYTTGGKVLVDWWIFTITTEGIKRAFLMIVRIMMLITGHLPPDLHHQPHSAHGRAGDTARALEEDKGARARDEHDDEHGAALHPHAH